MRDDMCNLGKSVSYGKSMKIPTLTPSNSLRTCLTLSLRERELPSPSRGGTGWGWVNQGIFG